jgi:ABC-type multidrug transport system ATPase subunit
LIPSGSITKQDLIDTAIIEEPETGLHPQAILSFCLLVLELLNRGYKVVISTHSPVILDVVWAIRGIMHLPEDIAVEALKEIFALHRMTPSIRDVLANALKKDYRVYYFERMPKKNAIIRDISSLDPSADNESVSGWGGLSGFSGRTADVVGKALAKGQNDASRP